LFVYVIALGLILLLREYARKNPSPIVEPAAKQVGVYLFAVLLINNYALWLLLPVPFLVALLLAIFWLFRPDEEVQRLRKISEEKMRRQRHLIRDIVDASSAGELFSAIQKSLLSKLKGAELTLEEYESKVEAYRSHLESKLELETVARNVQSREAVFAIGGPELWSNVMAAVRTGAALASGPLLIALYQFLPRSRVSYVYPVLTLLDFILSVLATWLLYAFFFGFYFAYLRGRSGLVKGIHLFVGLCLPFAVYRLLSAQPLDDMRFFLLVATQLFLFCTLLGLISVDYRLLRSNGFHLRDLTAVHNIPSLSAYASAAIAALVPTVIALITGKFGEYMKFVLEMILPKLGASN
jgi:ABC-type multidrug transport system fused ATPase/permease subunit